MLCVYVCACMRTQRFFLRGHVGAWTFVSCLCRFSCVQALCGTPQIPPGRVCSSSLELQAPQTVEVTFGILHVACAGVLRRAHVAQHLQQYCEEQGQHRLLHRGAEFLKTYKASDILLPPFF